MPTEDDKNDDQGLLVGAVPIEKGDVDDLKRKLVGISATSVVFAGFIMNWLNSYLSKTIPHMDAAPPSSTLKGSSNATPTGSPTPKGFPIPYNDLELIFISLSSSGVGILLGIAFLAYHISQKIHKFKIGENRDEDIKAFRRSQWGIEILQIFMAFGLLLGFLSVAFSIPLFHKDPRYPFICFTVPPICCALIAGLILCISLFV